MIRRFSLHEAGHCLAMWLGGGWIEKVTLYPPASGERLGDVRGQFEDPDKARKNIDFLFYGGLAELIEYPEAIGYSGDVKLIFEALSWPGINFPGMTDDAIRISRAGVTFEASQAFFDKHVEAYRGAFSDDAVKAVKALADVLETRKELSGSEAVSILESAFPVPPPGTIRADQHGGHIKRITFDVLLDTVAGLLNCIVKAIDSFCQPRDDERVERLRSIFIRATFELSGIRNKTGECFERNPES